MYQICYLILSTCNPAPPYLLDMLIFIVSFRCKFMNTLHYPALQLAEANENFPWNTAHTHSGKTGGKLILP